MDILGSVPTRLCEKQPSVRRTMSRSLSFSCHDQYLNGTATSWIMSLYGVKLYISSMMLKNCCWRGEEWTALYPLTFTLQLFAIDARADSELLFAWFGRGGSSHPSFAPFPNSPQATLMFPRVPQRITQHQQPLVHARRHCITATDFRDRPETMLKVSPIEFGASLSIPFCCHPSAFCFPLSISFFSLLNCKYHVPSILFCYSVITLLLLSFYFFL